MHKKRILHAVTVSMSLEFFTSIENELQQKGYMIISVSSPGPELYSLQDAGIKVVDVPMERRMSPFKDLRSLWKLIKVFRREKPDMVHSMTPKAGLLCMIAAWITRIPCRVHTFTGLVWPTAAGLSRKILMMTDWLTCTCATHIIPEGRGVMNDLQSCITNKPMKVLGYGNVRGVDMEQFNPNRFLSVKKNTTEFRFIFVGRIVSDKGINELVEAFARLNKEYPSTRLKIVGNYEDNLDPLKPVTLKMIDDNSSIEVSAPLYGDELLKEYVKADCFVMPSYREGFPNTVLEAGAMGLPSIVTDINGSREIIINGENGIIIPSKDTESLYLAMKQMLNNDSSREKMGANARPLIESRFEKSFVQKCLLDFYDEILY